MNFDKPVDKLVLKNQTKTWYVMNNIKLPSSLLGSGGVVKTVPWLAGDKFRIESYNVDKNIYIVRIQRGAKGAFILDNKSMNALLYYSE